MTLAIPSAVHFWAGFPSVSGGFPAQKRERTRCGGSG